MISSNISRFVITVALAISEVFLSFSQTTYPPNARLSIQEVTLKDTFLMEQVKKIVQKRSNDSLDPKFAKGLGGSS